MLPDISVRDIERKGKTEIPFVLKDCGADVTAVKVTASGTADKSNPGAFANEIPDGTEGGTTGVALSLTMRNGTYPFSPAGDQSEVINLTPLSDNRFSFYAQLIHVGTDLQVTPGKVSSVVNFTFDYQ
ncbi:fimbrial protein [Enterobacter hormaechei]|uniref:fimbrial protein n=1 Tax=Enterobacter hormaechei TaxID=158836 RepID=UPI0015D4B2A1